MVNIAYRRACGPFIRLKRARYGEDTMRRTHALMALALSALFILGFTACPALGSDSRSLTLSLSLGGADDAKTILPQSTDYLNIGSYVITLTPSSGTAVTQTVTSATCTFAALAATTYTISVSGYHASTGTGTVIVQGSASVDLSTQASASVSVPVSYILSGSGTGGISLTFTVPASTVTGTNVTLIAPSGSSSNPSLTAVTATSYTYANSAATVGTYQLYVSFNASGTVALVSETVVVLQGLTTTATIPLSSTDFKDKAVTGLSIPTGMTSFNLCPGQSLNLASSSYLTLSPSDALYAHVIWTTNNSSVATVSAGTVTAGTILGSPTITATSADDSSQHVSYSINVFSAFITSSVTGTASNYGNSSCSFQLSCTTPALTIPITGVTYSVDGGTAYPMTKSGNNYTASTTLTGADGAKAITLTATDNTHTWTTTLNAYRDTTPPSVSVVGNTVGSGEKVYPSSGTTGSNCIYISGTSVSTTFSLIDSLSGLKNYSLDTGASVAFSANNLTLSLNIGTHTLSITDGVGNVTAFSVTVATDTSIPNFSITGYNNSYTLSNKVYTTDNTITINVSYSDVGSGVATYTVGSGSPQIISNAISTSYTSGSTIALKVTDNLGNDSATVTTYPIVQDNNGPDISYSISDASQNVNGDWVSTSSTVTIALTLSDSGSGVNTCTFSQTTYADKDRTSGVNSTLTPYTGDTYSVPLAAVNDFEITCTDNLGNQSSTTFTILN
jgi:large repetitive protein